MNENISRKYLLILLLVLFSSLVKAQAVNENFDTFIYHFSTDSVFQTCRIQFPLEKISLTYDFMEETTSEIPKTEWKHNYLFMHSSSRAQIYDSFEKKLKDTDERVLSFLGVENGLEVYYYFKRLSGKWYLVKIEDFST